MKILIVIPILFCLVALLILIEYVYILAYQPRGITIKELLQKHFGFWLLVYQIHGYNEYKYVKTWGNRSAKRKAVKLKYTAYNISIVPFKKQHKNLEK